jgi:hypothetical protein
MKGIGTSPAHPDSKTPKSAPIKAACLIETDFGVLRSSNFPTRRFLSTAGLLSIFRHWPGALSLLIMAEARSADDSMEAGF